MFKSATIEKTMEGFTVTITPEDVGGEGMAAPGAEVAPGIGEPVTVPTLDEALNEIKAAAGPEEAPAAPIQNGKNAGADMERFQPHDESGGVK